MIKKIALMVLVLASFSTTYAQEKPFIILSGGVLYQGTPDGEITPYAACQPGDEGINGGLALAPDGENFAFQTMPAMVREAIEREGGIGGGAFPSNIWICGGEKGLMSVGVQPRDASFFTPNVPDKGVIRSEPIWSPDGTRVAWSELLYPDDVNQLAIYDLTSETLRTFPLDVPPQYGVPSPLAIKWGEPGLAVRSTTYDATTSQTTEEILLFDEQGQPITSFLLQSVNIFPSDFYWVQSGEMWLLGVLYNNDEWELIDPEVGAVLPLSTSLELVDPAATEEALTLRLNTNEDTSMSLTVLSPDGKELATLGDFYDPASRVAMSGQQVIYFTEALYLWENGKTTILDNVTFDEFTTSVAWTPLVWHVAE